MARLPAVKLVLWAMVAGCGRYHRTGNVVSAVTELLRGASWNLRGVPPALFRSPSERGVALLEVAVDQVSTERADGARSLSSGRAFGFVAAISWRPLRTDNSSSTRRNHEVIVRGEHGEDLFWGGGSRDVRFQRTLGSGSRAWRRHSSSCSGLVILRALRRNVLGLQLLR